MNIKHPLMNKQERLDHLVEAYECLTEKEALIPGMEGHLSRMLLRINELKKEIKNEQD